ncbi:MAG: aldo/keto reductase [Trueperaceae bacterium]|nr:aldo/keto reductase [Trueperaceae bacterium]
MAGAGRTGESGPHPPPGDLDRQERRRLPDEPRTGRGGRGDPGGLQPAGPHPEHVFPACQRHDLGVLARVPLASGYLSGKYRPDATFDDTSDVRSRHDRQDVQRKLEEAERIRREEVPGGVDMATWALAWCLQHPAVTCVIPGCKSVQQVEANAKAAELDMVRNDHPQAVAAPEPTL